MLKSTRRDQLAAGLTALGYTRLTCTLTKRYVVYRRPGSNRNWYLGAAGALRVGHTVRDSRPVGAATLAYVLTAPTVRPVVRELLGREPFSTATGRGVDPWFLANDVHRADPRLSAVETRVVFAHVSRYLREQVA